MSVVQKSVKHFINNSDDISLSRGISIATINNSKFLKIKDKDIIVNYDKYGIVFNFSNVLSRDIINYYLSMKNYPFRVYPKIGSTDNKLYLIDIENDDIIISEIIRNEEYYLQYLDEIYNDYYNCN